MNYIFLLGRILFGGFFVISGYSHFKNLSGMAAYSAAKKIPVPKLAVGFTGLLLMLGGLGVLLGVWVNFALTCLVVFLVPTTFVIHDYWNEADPAAKMNNQVNFKKNLALLGAVLMLYLIATPWAFSLMG